jgi:Na+/proline symporter/nitrogen-specific signal transduction histidine kinase
MSTPLIIVAALAYLLLLFAVAYAIEHGGAWSARITRSSTVYTLSLAVYCSSWTFNGGIGKASQSGIDFLPIYLGPTLVFALGLVLIRKMLRVSRANRITSIADFIGARFGKSTGLAALVTVIAVIGMVPYIALQLKSVSSGLDVLAASGTATDGAATSQPIWFDGALWATVVLAVFAMLFGSRSLHPDEHHPGMVVAVALESILKLVALTAVGLFVVYGIFHGFGDLFAKGAASPAVQPLYEHGGLQRGINWIVMTLLAMAAILCLPRQFQVMVVENVDQRHLSRALWQFPLYLLAINLFVLPIAIAARLTVPDGADPDSLVLTVPLLAGEPGLALVAFLGGLSAAASMVVVEATALSIMICNDVVMPALLRWRRLGLAERPDLTRLLLWIRRAAVAGLLALGYLYMRWDSERYALVSIGLISFLAVAQFAPAMIGGLFWRGATKAGAVAGISAGFAVWLYTQFLPSLAQSGLLPPAFATDGLFGITLLKPYALFGLAGLDPVTHSAFWSLLGNVGAFVGVSLLTQQSAIERAQASLFVDGSDFDEAARVWRRTARLPDLVSLAARFLGRERAHAAFAGWVRSHGLDPATTVHADAEMVLFAERLLAGVIGAASARVLVSAVVDEEPVGIDEVMRILDETSRVIEANRQLEEKSEALERATSDLKQANARLQVLDRLKDDFVATVNHELRTPLTSIRTFSEILRDNPGLAPDERQEFLQVVVTETERLTRLIDELLDLSKIEAGGAEPDLVPLDLAAVAEDCAASMRQVFAASGVRLRLALGGQPAWVVGDRDRLVQVIVNLLGNAVKFSPPGRGRVTLGIGGDDRSVDLFVADNGPGIKPADRESVFDRFRQVGDTLTDRPGGAGLGLAICRRIVVQHGGEIWVEDGEDGGAVFKVRFARVAAPHVEPAPRRLAQMPR